MRRTRTRKPDPSLQSTHVDDPCPKCGATTRRVGIRMDLEAESFPMLELCARCKHVFSEIPQ
jgi:hypothetical protein